MRLSLVSRHAVDTSDTVAMLLLLLLLLMVVVVMMPCMNFILSLSMFVLRNYIAGVAKSNDSPNY